MSLLDYLRGMKQRHYDTAPKQSIFFLGLSGAAFALIGGISLKWSVIRDPATYLVCSPATSAYFSWVPSSVAMQWLCALYTSLQSLPAHPGAYILVAQLVRFGSVFIPLIHYESHRARSATQSGEKKASRKGVTALVISQLVSGAVAIPSYLGLVWKERKGEIATQRASSEGAWAVLLGQVAAYLLPLSFGLCSNWSNTALSVFIVYPAYLYVIDNLVMPLIRPYTRGSTPTLPILAIAGIGVLMSAQGQWRMYLSNVPFRQILWADGPPSFVNDLHGMLIADYAVCSTALIAHVAFMCAKNGRNAVKAAAAMLAGALAVGPGGAIAAGWAVNELRGSSDDVSVAATERTRLTTSE